MKIAKIWYYPQAAVEFTWAEVQSLMMLSEKHYDYKCRQLGEQGGMLYGMVNRFDFPVSHTDSKIIYFLDTSEADLLAKCAEADSAMFDKLSDVLKTLNEEYRRVNKA